MDLELTEDQRMIQEAVRRFADERVAPNAYTWDKMCTRPAEVVGELAGLGLLGLSAPESIGGSALDRITGCIAIEEIARQDASLGLFLAIHNAAVLTQITASQGDVETRWGSALTSGEARGAWIDDGITAEIDGERCTLRGEAKFVALANEASVLFVRVGDRVAVVDVAASKFERVPIDNLLGLRATATATVRFDDVGAPLLSCAPALDASISTAMAAVAVGVARGALEEARRYALERKQFKKPIAEFQAIQWMIADMAMEIDAARMLTHHAAHLLDVDDDASRAAAEARLFSTEAAVRAGMKAVQIFGGNGFIREFPVERFLRDAKALAARDRTVDHQRDVIAASVLRG